MSPSRVDPADQPTHPGLIHVERGQAAFSSRAVSLQDVPAGTVFAKMTGTTPVTQRSYTTVQSSKDGNIELNSDLVYCNHSCDPSLVFDMKRMEARVIAERPLRKGEDLTFFYPSSEWDMAQPFNCNCGSPACVGTIQGAKYLDAQTLKKYWLNQHISDLVEKELRN